LKRDKQERKGKKTLVNHKKRKGGGGSVPVLVVVVKWARRGDRGNVCQKGKTGRRRSKHSRRRKKKENGFVQNKLFRKTSVAKEGKKKGIFP